MFSLGILRSSHISLCSDGLQISLLLSDDRIGLLLSDEYWSSITVCEQRNARNRATPGRLYFFHDRLSVCSVYIMSKSEYFVAHQLNWT